MTQRQDALTRRKLVADPNKTATEICKKMATDFKLAVSKDTIKRRMDANGMCEKKSIIQINNRKNLIENC